MKWIKASEEKSQHYVKVGCRLIGTDYFFTGAYDWSRQTYRGVDGRDYDPKDVEWLDESPSTKVKGQQGVEDALYKIAGLKRESLDLGESWYDRLTSAVSIAKNALASQPTTPQEVGVDKEAILYKHYCNYFKHYHPSEELPSMKIVFSRETIKYELAAMDEYAASLLKERDELKISLEMAQLGWNGTIDKKEDWENQAKALSAVKKGLEFMIDQQNTTINELMASNEAKEKECEYWKQRCEAAEDLIQPEFVYENDKEKYKKWQQLKNQTPNQQKK